MINFLISFVRKDFIAKALAKVSLLTIFLFTTSCATIHFDNGEVLPDPEPYWFEFWADDEEFSKADGIRYQQTYHHSLYTLAELSNPIQTSEICQGLDWNRVSADVTPIDLVLGLLDNLLFVHASAAGIDLWSPWSIEYSCKSE